MGPGHRPSVVRKLEARPAVRKPLAESSWLPRRRVYDDVGGLMRRPGSDEQSKIAEGMAPVSIIFLGAGRAMPFAQTLTNEQIRLLPLGNMRRLDGLVRPIGPGGIVRAAHAQRAARARLRRLDRPSQPAGPVHLARRRGQSGDFRLGSPVSK